MEIDHEEAKRDEAWSEAWRLSALELGIDPLSDDQAHVDLIGPEAEKLMKDWRISLPKSARA